MKIQTKHIILAMVILIIAIGTISAVSAAYKGTGFSTDVPASKYAGLSDSDILNKYNDTDCKVEASGKCFKVVDGDTVYIEDVGKIRLVGVNTPEKGVEGYKVAKDFVSKLCYGKDIGVDIDDSKNTDKYGRTLGVVIVDGKNLNEILLKEDLAEVMYMPPSEFYPYSWDN